MPFRRGNIDDVARVWTNPFKCDVRVSIRVSLIFVRDIFEGSRKIRSAPRTILFSLDLLLVFVCAVNCINSIDTLVALHFKLDSHVISTGIFFFDQHSDCVAVLGL